MKRTCIDCGRRASDVKLTPAPDRSAVGSIFPRCPTCLGKRWASARRASDMAILEAIAARLEYIAEVRAG